MTAHPILYSFRRCPYAIRARMALMLCGVSLELREVVLKNKPKELIELSSKATVPVLLTAGKSVIDESLDIMYWAFKQSNLAHWLNHIDSELIRNNDNEFKHWLDRYKYADRYPEQSEQYYRTQAETSLLKLEERLSQTEFLCGNEMSFTDLAIFPFIRQFAFVDIKWFEQSSYKKLRQWLDFFLASDSFQVVMHKYQPWTSTQKELFFFPIQNELGEFE